MKWYRNNPAARLVVRAIVVGVIAYFVQVLRAGQDAFDWRTFLWGLGSAAAYAAIGVFTPVEPQVGVKAKVRVPAKSTQTHPIL